MSDIIREPRQQRSIDKKNRIIEAGYELFANNGYFNTNTVDIAKLAGVSTGIVYGYFHDKRDILLIALDIYIKNAFNPILEMFDKIKQPLDFNKLVIHAVDSTIITHQKNAAMHETLHSLSATDKEINDKFLDLEEQMTNKIVSKLTSLDYNIPNMEERVHLAIETIQSYAHERVFDKHKYINYAEMREIVIKMIVSLFV